VSDLKSATALLLSGAYLANRIVIGESLDWVYIFYMTSIISV
jgi:hypothetical protein